MICYSVNRISGEMDLLACPLRRDEGQPLPWRCHLQHDTIVNAALRKASRKTFIRVWNSGDGERWIQKGGGIRRAQAEPACGFFLSQQCSAVSYTTSTTCCCLVREILEPKLLSNHMHSWFFTELEGKFHFWPRRCVRPHGEGVDMFGFTPGSASPLFACT